MQAFLCARLSDLPTRQVSKTSSSIHNTTLRHTSPTALARCEICGSVRAAPSNTPPRSLASGPSASTVWLKRTPNAPDVAASNTPSLPGANRAASPRQVATDSSKLPTIAKPNAVTRTGMKSTTCQPFWAAERMASLGVPSARSRQLRARYSTIR